MIASSPLASRYYVTPVVGDFRQGDIYATALHLMLTGPDVEVLRGPFSAKGGKQAMYLHTLAAPPVGGFNWTEKERVAADGQISTCIVLTHDCEIENSDNKEHRLIGIVRELDRLSDADRDVIVRNEHFGRMYLPSWHAVGLSESYVDLRRITTVRGAATLPEADRIASMTDLGRELLQDAVIRYLTEQHRT